MKLKNLGEWIQVFLPQEKNLSPASSVETSQPPLASSYRSTSSSIASEAKGQVALQQKQLARELSNPDPKTMEKLSALNRKRETKGMPPVDLPKVTREIEAIQKDSKLNDKQKKEKIEQIRRRLGLSKGEMKSLFTKRMEAAYKKAEKALAGFEQAKAAQLQAELTQAEADYGKDSAQAKTVRSKLDSLRSSLEPEKKKLQSKAKFFGALYPSFFSKLGSAFKKIGGALSKALGVLAPIARFIPGIGPALSKAIHTVQALLQGKVGQFGKSLLGLLGTAKNLLPAIPGVGTIASFAVNGLQALVRAARS